MEGGQLKQVIVKDYKHFGQMFIVHLYNTIHVQDALSPQLNTSLCEVFFNYLA